LADVTYLANSVPAEPPRDGAAPRSGIGMKKRA